ncbi:MAG: hypothetical protein PF481_00380 [Bacteroidales bacterium]|jgi:hypothetical protein|nr:hypothetical protein [Bacteroidales bacterium]
MKTRKLNNIEDFKIKPQKLSAETPEDENIIGGDAPKIKNTEHEKEIKKLYKKMKSNSGK